MRNARASPSGHTQRDYTCQEDEIIVVPRTSLAPLRLHPCSRAGDIPNASP